MGEAVGAFAGRILKGWKARHRRRSGVTSGRSCSAALETESRPAADRCLKAPVGSDGPGRGNGREPMRGDGAGARTKLESRAKLSRRHVQSEGRGAPGFSGRARAPRGSGSARGAGRAGRRLERGPWHCFTSPRPCGSGACGTDVRPGTACRRSGSGGPGTRRSAARPWAPRDRPSRAARRGWTRR
jgi:hypothetical protein